VAKVGRRAGIGLLPQAEAAFRRALEINPDLSSATNLAAYVDAELGRAPEAIRTPAVAAPPLGRKRCRARLPAWGRH
jgi:hypothetical protein